MDAKFQLIGNYAGILAFDAFVQQAVSDALPNVLFHREGPQNTSPADVYQYLLEQERDERGQMNCAPFLSWTNPATGEWQPLTDAPHLEKSYFDNVAALWLALIPACEECRAAALAASAQVVQRHAPDNQ